jgi:hypothetical protein
MSRRCGTTTTNRIEWFDEQVNALSVVPHESISSSGACFSAMTMSVARAADCDRTCLKGMITKYLDAMVARDPSRLPLAAGARFTEDSPDLKLGEGLWKTVSKKGDFRQDYIDLAADRGLPRDAV